MTRSLLVVALALAVPAVGAAEDEWYYATKADAKAGRRTPGRPVVAPQVQQPLAGGENCVTPTVIASLPFTDSDDTTGNTDDVSALAGQCADYTQARARTSSTRSP